MDWLDFSQQDLVRIAAHVAGSLLAGALLVWFFRRAQRRPAKRRGHSDVRILEYGPALRWLFPVFAIGFGWVGHLELGALGDLIGVQWALAINGSLVIAAAIIAALVAFRLSRTRSSDLCR